MTETIPKNYFTFHLTILRVVGINIYDINHPIFRILYNAYAFIFILFSFLIFTVLEFITICSLGGNLDKMTFVLCYWISHFMGCLKMAIFMFNKKNIRKYLSLFEEGVFQPDVKRGGQKEINIIKRAITVASTQANIFYLLAFIIISNRVVYAIRDDPKIYDTYDSVTNTTNVVVERTLPWDVWFWFDTKPTPIYQLVFFYQVWGVSIFGVEIGVLDTLVSAMLVHLNAQFSILHNAILTISERAKAMQNVEQNSESIINNNKVKEIDQMVNKIMNKEGWEEIPKHDAIMSKNFETCVKNCLEHHIKIIALSDNVEDQFNLMVLVQILGSMLMFCFQLVQVSFMPLFSIRFISITLYLGLMIFQLGIYCYNGNEISLQSEKIAEAAYNCDWFPAENKMKKYLVLMMLRAQRPIKMSAGKFAFLSLATFMNIIRGSVSYFMVLHRQNSKPNEI